MEQNTSNESQNLAKAPIISLMLKFSIPCILSLLVSSLYNIVDQIFIGWGVGYLGNGATNVVFPITVIALAFSLMIGDGCAAFLSICQGRKDLKSAHKSVGNAVVLLTAIGVILSLLFSIFKNQILFSFGATENNLQYALDYFNIIVIGIPFFVFSSGANSIIRADGSPKFAMLSSLIGCIVNVILDPIAIFVLHWELKGAALATIAGQIVSAFLGIYYMSRPKTFKLSKQSLLPDIKIIKGFIPLGISSLLTQVSIVIIMGVMNTTLVKYGAESKYGADIPMTVVGIVMKVFQIVISFVVGIAAGCQPVVGYNYGAGKFDRVKQIYKYMCVAIAVIGVIATFMFELFPVQIISIFGSEGELYNEFATLSFRIYLSTILFCCLQKASSIFLQSIGKPIMAMTLSLLRDFIFIVPLVLLLPRLNDLGVIGPLFAAPVSDTAAFIVTVIMMLYVNKKLNLEKNTAVNKNHQLSNTKLDFSSD